MYTIVSTDFVSFKPSPKEFATLEEARAEACRRLNAKHSDDLVGYFGDSKVGLYEAWKLPYPEWDGLVVEIYREGA